MNRWLKYICTCTCIFYNIFLAHGRNSVRWESEQQLDPLFLMQTIHNSYKYFYSFHFFNINYTNILNIIFQIKVLLTSTFGNGVMKFWSSNLHYLKCQITEVEPRTLAIIGTWRSPDSELYAFSITPQNYVCLFF